MHCLLLAIKYVEYLSNAETQYEPFISFNIAMMLLMMMIYCWSQIVILFYNFQWKVDIISARLETICREL